ncbi:hypothetical protein IFU40_06050 [Microbacterium sp. CFBP 13617]|uniref:hypothetical protein n=1 Tax=Microbacterium sp. CFBP 13617 TaxID=2774035 RepID=UPI00177B2EE9|nr:hypothetical protein [Microbacterium sp. CFBP 13617]MBD8218194.1 hypothetical protein [Microbacterium sp. CFBP 13617]
MGEAARRANDEKSKVVPRIGRYVGADGGHALVDLGDQRVPVQFATPWVPTINEPVWVDSVDGRLRLVGPTSPKPGIGVVETINTAGTSAVVQTDFGKHTLIVAPTNPLPTSGDTVGIQWSSQPWCTLLIDVPDPTAPPPAPIGGGGTTRTAEFRAIDAGSTDRDRPRWWTGQPWSSDSTYGAWFYGTQIKDTIPPGAEFVALEFYVAWSRRRYGGSRFALHTDPYKAGIPSMGAVTEWNPNDGWQTPPNAEGWFGSLKAAGGRYGVGLDQGGWEEFKSLAQDGMSGALRITWR